MVNKCSIFPRPAPTFVTAMKVEMGKIGEENLPGWGAHREKGNEEGSITLRLFEKVMGNTIILCLLKITCNVYI